MVSRKHATIAFTGGEVLIQDLGSTNGTFVNGEKVKRAALKDGDRVLIGTSILKVVHATAPGASAFQRGEPVRSAENVSTLRPRTLHGDLSEQGLPSILQLLSSSKHTGVLTIQGPRVAKLFFREGQLVKVTTESSAAPLGAKKALHRVLGWASGAFSVQVQNDGFEKEFEDTPTDTLVSEGVKAAEETRRARERLPAGAKRFDVVRPLMPLLKDLSPKRLDTLQLVLNHGDLDSILDRNPVSDLDVYRHLLYLLQKEYIRVAPPP
jgi:hypothetical protein